MGLCKTPRLVVLFGRGVLREPIRRFVLAWIQASMGGMPGAMAGVAEAGRGMDLPSSAS